MHDCVRLHDHTHDKSAYASMHAAAYVCFFGAEAAQLPSFSCMPCT